MARTISRRPSGDESPAKTVGRRRGTSKAEPETDNLVSSGWDAYNAVAKETASGDFTDDLEVEEDPTIIKILDAEPISYKQHWVERKGKKSFVCLGDDCPLCDDIANKTRAMACFNVVEFSDPENPTLKILRQGAQVANTLRKFSEDPKLSPLDREDIYFAISKTKQNKKVQYTVLPVKKRDLEEDYDVSPLTEEEIESFQEDRLDRTNIVHVSSRSDLQEVADEYVD